MAHHLPEGRLRVLLCGYGHLGLALLQGLLGCAQDCEIVGVFRWTARPGTSQYWEPIEGLFQKQVEQHGIRDIVCKGMNSYEFTALLKELQPDVVLVGSWGEILKPHLIEHPDIIFINCHPSKLPAHRGANPYASVILEQAQETGVTFHRMASQIDAGAVFLQRGIPLLGEENGEIVRDKCMHVAYEMVPELVHRLKAHIMDGAPLEEIPQEHALQSYFPQLKPAAGAINWNDSPDAIWRQMRALFPWIACYATLNRKVRVMFYDPNFVTVPPEQQRSHTPGTIVSLEKGKLRIALSEPTRVLEVSMYQIVSGNHGCPQWLSRVLAHFLLRPGTQFSSATPK
jgi:methionyl-tRNA formyltransferase